MGWKESIRFSNMFILMITTSTSTAFSESDCLTLLSHYADSIEIMQSSMVDIHGYPLIHAIFCLFVYLRQKDPLLQQVFFWVDVRQSVGLWCFQVFATMSGCHPLAGASGFSHGDIYIYIWDFRDKSPHIFFRWWILTHFFPLKYSSCLLVKSLLVDTYPSR